MSMLKLHTARTQATRQIDNGGHDANVASNPKLETPLGPTQHRVADSGLLTKGPVAQVLSAAYRTVRNAAAFTAVAGLTLGLAGCNLGETPTEPRPYEPMQVHMSADENGVEIGRTGESRIAADLRIALHHHANAKHEGSRSRLFLHHAGEDQQLSSNELAAMMEAAGVGSNDIARTLGANAAIAFRDATKDRKLSWGEFKPVIYAPSELAEGK